jgi:hypothetical protein
MKMRIVGTDATAQGTPTIAVETGTTAGNACDRRIANGTDAMKMTEATGRGGVRAGMTGMIVETAEATEARAAAVMIASNS